MTMLVSSANKASNVLAIVTSAINIMYRQFTKIIRKKQVKALKVVFQLFLLFAFTRYPFIHQCFND